MISLFVKERLLFRLFTSSSLYKAGLGGLPGTRTGTKSSDESIHGGGGAVCILCAVPQISFPCLLGHLVSAE